MAQVLFFFRISCNYYYERRVKNMLNKIKDFFDTSVGMVILMDDEEQLLVLSEVIVSIGRERCTYEIYKDEITAYMMELRMPYNRYLAMMQGLQKRGWNLKPETKADIFNRMIRNRA